MDCGATASLELELELEQAQQVRTFVKITNLTQTAQLHEWNLESLRRALQWAHAAEDAVAASDETAHGQQQEVEARIRRWFPVATLPTLPLDEALSAMTLRHATSHLLRAILQSPFLASHPVRSELLVAVLQQLKGRHDDESPPPNESTSSPAISELLTAQVASTSRTNAMLAIARRLSGGCARIHVRGKHSFVICPCAQIGHHWTDSLLQIESAVLSGSVSILPLRSFALSPRTLQLKVMAKTLQRNVVDARAAVDSKTYRTFLADLNACFAAPESGEIREVVVIMLVMCEWPNEEPEQLQGMMHDLVQIVSDWVTDKPIRFWTFRPWLAAMLTSKSQSLAASYVAVLFERGSLPPWESEFAERVATLLMQNDDVGGIVQPALAKLDPYLVQRYFNVGPSCQGPSNKSTSL